MVIFFGGFTAAGAYISELAVSNYQTKKKQQKCEMEQNQEISQNGYIT